MGDAPSSINDDGDDEFKEDVVVVKVVMSLTTDLKRGKRMCVLLCRELKSNFAEKRKNNEGVRVGESEGRADLMKRGYESRGRRDGRKRGGIR